MASFFKKALSVFVEFDENQETTETAQTAQTAQTIQQSPGIPTSSISKENAEKFEAYFEKVFEKANFPGPDYYEFYKMMEALETAIPDEKTRFSATFASLSIQGLTKQNIIDTANKYKTIIEHDKVDFDKALAEKTKVEVDQRQNELLQLDNKIKTNSEQIQKLTKEISDSQIQIAKLKAEVVDEQNKIAKNNSSYQVASQAIMNKINTDIQKIQTLL
jgi:hypothetical protein